MQVSDAVAEQVQGTLLDAFKASACPIALALLILAMVFMGWQLYRWTRKATNGGTK